MTWTKEPTEKTQFVVLRNPESGDSFFTHYRPGTDQTLDEGGEVIYRVLAYSEGVYGAQEFLYGKKFADLEEANRRAKKLDPDSKE